ncbi:MAG: carboxymuconolactone decarboxylase family protein [Planctomycetota bacterium]
MPRLNEVEPEEATGETAEIYDAVKQKYGSIPNLLKGLANSPAALKAYLGIGEAMEGAALTEAEQHVVYLVASQNNQCSYCISAHSYLAEQSGLSGDEVMEVRQGMPDEPRRRALVRFARAVIAEKGFVSDEQLREFRKAGYGDAHAAEVCAVIAQSTLSNFFNHVHETELDFPRAPGL